MLYATVPQFTKMLKNLDQILDKAVAHAAAKKFDPSVYIDSRLAPDQFTFVRQVQAACDIAKLGVARLIAQQAPVHEDTERSIPELKARIAKVIDWLASIEASAFEGAAERRITTPRWEGKTLSGAEFATQHVLPNFYFHVTTAYAILRHNGVDVGKRDYLGPMPFRDPS